MKHKHCRATALLSALLIILSGCGNKPVEYEQYELTPNEIVGASSKGSYVVDNTAQLTEDDIQKMNQGKARFAYSKDGYVTFINGRFSDKKVENYEDAVGTVQQVAGLIGLNAGSEFFASFYSRDDDGYTYYTFQQKYGKLTVLYATLRIVVAPDGYTAALSCSFTPNIGIASATEDVGPERAMEILKSNLNPEMVDKMTFYPEHTHKLALTLYETTYSVYALYSNNPFDTGREFDMRYMEFFVTTDGLFISDVYYPVASFGTDSFDAYRNESYFAPLKATDKSFTVTRVDGSKETITVPVSYNSSNGLYYLADPGRKIAVASYSELVDNNRTTLHTSTTGDDWRNQDLLAYDRYIKAYDFYASLGLYSVDGNGIPILVCTGLPEDNACYFGINNGWACFATSDLNTYSEAMDVVGHEFTHGITANSMTSHKYLGVTGAINEAYSDIMGNLMERTYNMSYDSEEWLIGEMSGITLRSMSDPHAYNQPTSTTDRYYHDPEDLTKDKGGVHINSSLLHQMVYKLHQSGMTLSEQCSLWLTSIEMLTPLSEYNEVLEILLMSIKINGFDEKYADVLIDAFAKAGMSE